MDRHLLANIPLFTRLGDAETELLSRTLVSRSHQAGTAVYEFGTPGDDFYVVQVGHVTLTCPDAGDHDTPLAELGAGEFFGEIETLDGGPRTATARAASNVILLSMSRHAFLDFLEQRPLASAYLVSVLAARQRELLDRLRTTQHA